MHAKTPLLSALILTAAACAPSGDLAHGPKPKPNATASAKLEKLSVAKKTETTEPKPSMQTLTARAPAEPASILDQPAAREPVAGHLSALEPALDTEVEVHDATYGGEELVKDIAAEDVRVVRFVLTSDVQGREPVDERDVFSEDAEKIFAFVHLDNAEGLPYAVNVHFEAADGPKLPYGIELPVQTAPRWRTWAYTQIRREPGFYRAVLRTPDGEDIAFREFEVVPADDDTLGFE